MARRHAKMLSLLLASSLISGCSTVTDTVDNWMGDSKPSASAPAKLQAFKAEVAPLAVWDHEIGDGSEGLISQHQPVRAGNRLYASAVDGTVRAVALPSGDTLWSRQLEQQLMSGVAVGKEQLYVGTDAGRLVALDRTNGSERWSVNLLSEILAPATEVEGKVVVVRTADGKLSALDTEEGKMLWSYEREVPVLTLRGTSSPVVSDGRVFAGLDSGEVVAVALEDGRELWIKSVTVPRGRTEIERMVDIDATPVVVGNALYVVGYQGNLVALDVETGDLLWKRKLSSLRAPSVQAKYLFVSDQAGAIWAFDRHDGSALWRQEGLKNRNPSSPLPDGRYLVVGDNQGVLHWLGIEDGRFAGRYQLDSQPISAATLEYGEAVISYSESGKLSLITP